MRDHSLARSAAFGLSLLLGCTALKEPRQEREVGSAADAGRDASVDTPSDAHVRRGRDAGRDGSASQPVRDAGSSQHEGDAAVASADPCAIDHGGCDPVTTCRVEDGTAVCGACPYGYADASGAGTRCVCAPGFAGVSCEIACAPGELLTSHPGGDAFARPSHWLCARAVAGHGWSAAGARTRLRGEISVSAANVVLRGGGYALRAQ